MLTYYSRKYCLWNYIPNSSKKYISKSHLQNVSHFVPASMSQSEPFKLHVNWCEPFRWVIMSFMLIVMYIYFGSRTFNSRGLFYWHGLTFIPCIIKCGIKLLINSETSQGNGWVMLLHMSQGMWLLVHAGIQVNPRRWNGPLSVILVYVMA